MDGGVPAREAPQGAVHRWRERLRRLAEPHPSLVESVDRRRARLSAGLGLLLLVLSAVGIVFTAAQAPSLPDLRDIPILITFLVAPPIAAGYILSRTANYGRGGAVLVITLLVAVWLLALNDAFAARDPEILYFLAIPIVVAPFVLRFVPALVVLTANALFLVVAPAIFHRVVDVPLHPEQYASVVWFIVLFTPIAILAGYLQERDLQLLEDGERRLRRANEELQGVDKNRLEFVNTIAHDLGSPLTPIRVQLHLLETGEPTPQTAQRVAMIKRNVGQMQRLVEDLRDVAKLQAGKLRMDQRPTDLAQLASHACESFRAAAADRQIQIHFDASEPVQVLADPERITQVLYNYVGNALKFTPDGGSVEVALGRFAGEARLYVTDTGRGLTPDEQVRLFRPFTQVHERSEARERGTGLGLYISRQIVEAHGGQTAVESRGRGHGSTFWLSLPCIDPEASKVGPG